MENRVNREIPKHAKTSDRSRSSRSSRFRKSPEARVWAALKELNLKVARAWAPKENRGRDLQDAQDLKQLILAGESLSGEWEKEFAVLFP
jgi:hypothetical protein